MNTLRLRPLSFVAHFSLLVGLTALSPRTLLAISPPLFSENFNAVQQNPHLDGYDRFVVGDGVIRRNGVFQDVNDRRYIRTVATNYNEINFRFELTFTTTTLTTSSVMFMGIGTGDRRQDMSFGHNEPWQSLFFRAHVPNLAGGKVSVSNRPAADLNIIGAIGAGTHRGRIEKVGKAITYSLDANFNGAFAADMSITYPDLFALVPTLNSTNSRLFFGTVLPNDSFDDMLVVPEPAALSIAALGAIAIAARRRR